MLVNIPCVFKAIAWKDHQYSSLVKKDHL